MLVSETIGSRIVSQHKILKINVSKLISHISVSQASPDRAQISSGE